MAASRIEDNRNLARLLASPEKLGQFYIVAQITKDYGVISAEEDYSHQYALR